MAHCPNCRTSVGWKALLAGGGIVCSECQAELEVQRWSKVLIMMAATTIALFAEDSVSYLGGSSGSIITVLVLLPLLYFVLASLLLQYRIKPSRSSPSSTDQTGNRSTSAADDPASAIPPEPPSR